MDLKYVCYSYIVPCLLSDSGIGGPVDAVHDPNTSELLVLTSNLHPNATVKEGAFWIIRYSDKQDEWLTFKKQKITCVSCYFYCSLS